MIPEPTEDDKKINVEGSYIPDVELECMWQEHRACADGTNSMIRLLCAARQELYEQQKVMDEVLRVAQPFMKLVSKFADDYYIGHGAALVKESDGITLGDCKALVDALKEVE